MDNSTENGRSDPVGGPTPAAARELRTDDMMVALTAVLRWRIVLGWLPPDEQGATT